MGVKFVSHINARIYAVGFPEKCIVLTGSNWRRNMKIRALLSALLPFLLPRVLCKKDEADGIYGNHGGEEIFINREKRPH
jgi:hypothetical protein